MINNNHGKFNDFIKNIHNLDLWKRNASTNPDSGRVQNRALHTSPILQHAFIEDRQSSPLSMEALMLSIGYVGVAMVVIGVVMLSQM